MSISSFKERRDLADYLLEEADNHEECYKVGTMLINLVDELLEELRSKDRSVSYCRKLTLLDLDEERGIE